MILLLLLLWDLGRKIRCLIGDRERDSLILLIWEMKLLGFEIVFEIWDM